MIVVVFVLTGSVDAPSVEAAAFDVDSTADEHDIAPGNGLCETQFNDCSLRAAIDETNALAGHDTVTVPAGEYPGISILDGLTLTGAGAKNTVIDGIGVQAPYVSPCPCGPYPTVFISDVTSSGGVGIQGDGFYGLDNSIVTLERVVVTDSMFEGVYNEGVLTIIDSAIVDNGGAGTTGGIVDEGTMHIINTTISGNRVSSGPSVAAVRSTYGASTLENVTITGNRGQIAVAGPILMRNTIIAGNLPPFGGPLPPECGPGVTSLGHNIADDASCNLTASGDLPNTDPLLGPLANNGGQTPTHTLLAGSPALESGECVTTADQRGVGRPADADGNGNAGCDIGAYEATLALPVGGIVEISKVGTRSGLGGLPDQLGAMAALAVAAIALKRHHVAAVFTRRSE